MDYYNNAQQQAGAYLPSINYYINDEHYANQAAAFAANQLDPLNTYGHHHHQLNHQLHHHIPLIEQPAGVTNNGNNGNNNKRRLSDVTNEDFDDVTGIEHVGGKKSKPMNPFAPECSIPLPFQLGDEYGYFGPASIWKRNERERHRVRCVNDGYEKLRSNLPFFDKEKRLSKVETLRLAIRYIHHLQKLLINENHNETCTCNLDVQAACSPRDEPCETKRRRNGKKQKFSSDDSDSFEDVDF